jgi:hypothetical protein
MPPLNGASSNTAVAGVTGVNTTGTNPTDAPGTRGGFGVLGGWTLRHWRRRDQFHIPRGAWVYTPTPYAQLARVLRDEGKPEVADAVLSASKEQERCQSRSLS